MNEILEKDFQSKIDTLKDKINVLHFSCGADSVASYLKLKENGIRPVLVYNYFLPHLKMVDNYINYFEKKFSERIYQFPSVLFSEMIDNALFQLPIKARERFRNRIGCFELSKHTKEKFDNFLDTALGGNVIHHLGIRYSDGIRRYQHLSKNKCSFKDKFYPIASFKVSDIQDILDRHDCLLPIEYSLWGLSFESPRAWNIGLIKEHCPETSRQITEVFPLIGAEALRKYATLNKHHKQRITQFGQYAMPKGDLTW